MPNNLVAFAHILSINICMIVVMYKLFGLLGVLGHAAIIFICNLLYEVAWDLQKKINDGK